MVGMHYKYTLLMSYLDQPVVLTGMTLVLGEKSIYMQQMVRTIKFMILGMV